MNIYTIESDFSAFEEKTGIQGDFARILWSGFVIHSRKKDQTAVERFGENVPPIYVESRQIILTEATKQKLQNFDLQGFTFQEVEKRKIIKGDWQNFSMDFFEAFDDPTFDSIEYGEHSVETAENMPQLWRIKPLHFMDFKKVDKDIFEFSTTEFSDFYEATGDKLGIFISEKAKEIFENLSLPLTYQKI